MSCYRSRHISGAPSSAPAAATGAAREYFTKARDFVDRRQISTPLIEQALDLCRHQQ